MAGAFPCAARARATRSLRSQIAQLARARKVKVKGQVKVKVKVKGQVKVKVKGKGLS